MANHVRAFPTRLSGAAREYGRRGNHGGERTESLERERSARGSWAVEITLDKQVVSERCPECEADFTVVRGSVYDGGQVIWPG